MKSRGMLKFGQLLLNDDYVGETSLISTDWVDQTFKPYIKMNNPFYMGYQWRSVISENGFHSNFISGNGGQLIVVFHELNMVVVVTADNRGEKHPLGGLVERVLKIHPSQK